MLKGNLEKVGNLVDILNIYQSKKEPTKLILRSPSTELVLCLKGGKVGIKPENGLSPEATLWKFLEEWVIFGFSLSFEAQNANDCRIPTPLTIFDLQTIVANPYLEKVGEIPALFVIEEADTSKLPSVLSKFFFEKEPLSIKDLYKLDLSITKLVELREEDILKISNVDKISILLPYLTSFASLAIIAALVYSILPINDLTSLTKERLLEGLNWALREKVLSNANTAVLPVKDCFGNNLIFKEDKIISPGWDKKLGNGNDFYIELPKNNYKPFFAIPVK
ncbi:MAG: hypothetical protein ABGX27_00640 [Desulfurobacteriaceae bacterium]